MDIADLNNISLPKSEMERIINLSMDLISIAEFDGYFKYLNSSWQKVFGYTTEELLSKPFISFIHPGDHHHSNKEVNKLAEGYESINYVNRCIHKDGSIKYISWNAKTLDNRIYCIGRDITEQKKCEELIFQSQKMDAIGHLAGGIAHDFNNILTGVFGNISMTKTMLPKEHPGLKYIEDSEKAMNRAIHLTSQLLTFAIGGGPVKENTSLGNVIKEVSQFDLSGSKVKLVFEQPKNLWVAKVDKGQIQQVFSNLTLNAKQAMPNGGTLFISLQNIDISENMIPNLIKGKYIKAIVKDQGIGIDSRHLKRIFEPFFTTKLTGRGLGMATVYSIIDKHGGIIDVKSIIGKGTTFTLYLPAAKSQQHLKTKLLDVANQSEKQHPTKILVMDDEVMICNLLSGILKNNGFLVSTAYEGKQAVIMYKQSIDDDEPFDIVIMDLTIPGGMGGKEAIIEILKIDPAAKCIISSGYSNDPIMAEYANYGFKGLVPKPYIPSDLINTLNQVLNK